MTNRSSDFPLEVPETPFDQRNEMFKRRTWDKPYIPMGKRLYENVELRKCMVIANLIMHFAMPGNEPRVQEFASGMVHGNTGLYSWHNVAPKVKRFIEAGGRCPFLPS